MNTEQMNKLLEELRALIALIGSPEIDVVVSAIMDIEDADPSEKMGVLKEITFKALESKADAFSRIENIVRCIAEAGSDK